MTSNRGIRHPSGHLGLVQDRAQQGFAVLHSFNRTARPVQTDALRGALTPRVLAKRAQVFVQGQPADYFYKVISGAICTYRLLNNGRRLIDAFYVAGDIFGLEAYDEHRASAATMSEATVIAIERHRLDMLLASEAGQEIISSLMRSLERAQTLTMLLRHNSAKERVSAFLLDMADRTSRRDNFKFRHMDIADYLGLSRETVSRVLAQLATKRIDRRGQGSARAEASAVAVRTESVAVPL